MFYNKGEKEEEQKQIPTKMFPIAEIQSHVNIKGELKSAKQKQQQQ